MSSSSSSRGQTDRRAAILKAAARLFEHYGHGKTTMVDVAREAQIGVGTLYLEFDSKDDIVEALASSTHDAVLDAMRAAAKRDRNHVDRFGAVLMARTMCFLDLGRKGQHACELVHCKGDVAKGGVRSAQQRFVDAERALLVAILEEGREDHVFGAIDAVTTAALVQRSFASLSPPHIFGAKAEDMLRTCDQMCDLLLRGVIARKPFSGSPRRRKPR